MSKQWEYVLAWGICPSMGKICPGEICPTQINPSIV